MVKDKGRRIAWCRPSFALFFGLIFFAVLLAGCELANSPSGSIPAGSVDQPELDVTLRVLYDFMGGEKVLGPVISGVSIENARKFQYTTKAMLVYDENKPATEVYALAPLGYRVGIMEAPAPAPSQPGAYYTNGHTVDPDFAAFIDEDKWIFVGLPISEVIYNPSKQRFEQYFENIGFYKSQVTGEIGLLDYGAFDCKDKCRQVEAGPGAIEIRYREAEVFKPFINKYGWRFTGFPITKIYALDEKWLQVFQNMVLIADSQAQPDSVRLLSIADELEMIPETPAIGSGAPDMNFYPTDGNLGYDIPLYFWEYILAHGGLETSGAPITHLQTSGGSSLRQCFENLCLIYDPAAPSSLQVMPEPLGIIFMGKTGEVSIPGTTQPEQQRSFLKLRVKEMQATISTSEQQIIEVSAMRDGYPVPGIVMEIIITMPDETTQSYVMPATGSDGRTTLTLPAIQAENGSVILYLVCVNGLEETDICYEDSFAIWSNP